MTDDYWLLCYDPVSKMWQDIALFDTIEAAQEEIEYYKELVPDEPAIRYVIIQNDGEEQKKYRPLDLGDEIRY